MHINLFLSFILISSINLSNCYFILKKQLKVNSSQIYYHFISCGFDNQLFIPYRNGSLFQFDQEVYRVPGVLVFPRCFRFSQSLESKRRYVLMTTPYADSTVETAKMPGFLFRNEGGKLTKINFPISQGLFILQGGISNDYLLITTKDQDGDPNVYIYELSHFDAKMPSLQNFIKVNLSDTALKILNSQKQPKYPLQHPQVQVGNSFGFVGDVFGNFIYYSTTIPNIILLLAPIFNQIQVKIVEDQQILENFKQFSFEDASIYSPTKNQSKFYFYYYLDGGRQIYRRYLQIFPRSDPKYPSTYKVGPWELTNTFNMNNIMCQDRLFSLDKKKLCIFQNDTCAIQKFAVGFCDRQHSVFGGKAKLTLYQISKSDKNKFVFSLYEETRLDLIIFVIGMSVLGVLILSIVVSFLYCHFKKGLSFKEFVTFKCCRKQKQNKQQKNQQNQGTYNKIQN